MKIKSWEQLGLDTWRVLLFILAVGSLVLRDVAAAGRLLQVGDASLVLGMIAAGGASYLVATAPRRLVQRAAFEQTLEAPSFAASSNIYLKLHLLAEQDSPSASGRASLASASFLEAVRRRVLLGYDAGAAIEAGRPASHLFSESVRAVMSTIVGIGRARVEEGGEELDGILNSSGLDDETKLPLFIAVVLLPPDNADALRGDDQGDWSRGDECARLSSRSWCSTSRWRSRGARVGWRRSGRGKGAR